MMSHRRVKRAYVIVHEFRLVSLALTSVYNHRLRHAVGT